MACESCDTCETVKGTTPSYIVFRETLFLDGCYRFWCNCPESAGKYGNRGLKNEGFLWSDRLWNGPDGLRMLDICPHLFACLTIYEDHRMRVATETGFVGGLPRDTYEILNTGVADMPGGIDENPDWLRARDAAIGHGKDGGALSYLKMHTLLETCKRTIEDTELSWLYIRDAKDAPIYTVKCIDDKWSCTCKGFIYHNKCKHITLKLRIILHLQQLRELGISLAILALQ